MVLIEDSGADTKDAVLRDREQGQHAPQPSPLSPTRFLLQWVTASLLGAGIAATLGAAILGSNAYFPPWRLALFLGIVGLGVGAGQAMVIARLWPGSPRSILRGVWWMLGTAAGFSIGVALSLPLSFPVFFILYALEDYYWVTVLTNIPLIMGIVVDVVAAATVSLTQLFLLRRYANALGRGNSLASLYGW